MFVVCLSILLVGISLTAVAKVAMLDSAITNNAMVIMRPFHIFIINPLLYMLLLIRF